MKKYLSLAMMTLLCVGVLAGCGGAKEVDSRDEANRVLLSASSVVAECESLMKEYDKVLDDTKMSPQLKLNQVKEKDLKNIEKRLDGAYEEIRACDSYKDVEDVKPKYDSALDKQKRAVKHLGYIRDELVELEEKK